MRRNVRRLLRETFFGLLLRDPLGDKPGARGDEHEHGDDSDNDATELAHKSRY
jgi:hypothetical protein